MRRFLSSNSEEQDASVDITPMLDVVFIMLIFFIVTASFIKEAGIEVRRPETEQAQPKPKANILVAISPKNEIWIDRKNIDPRAVQAEFERLLAENPEGSVVILADKASQTGLVIQVLDQARLAGIESVAVAAAPDT